jgi:hypothetical protein
MYQENAACCLLYVTDYNAGLYILEYTGQWASRHVTSQTLNSQRLFSVWL